jgi:type IV secretory pathway VirB10-like protein
MFTGGVSRSVAEFGSHGGQARKEPEFGPSTVFRTAYPNTRSDSPVDAAGLSNIVSRIDAEPRLFDPVPRETRPTSASSRSALAERLRVNSVFYLLLAGFVAAAIIGVFFGIAFALLKQPKDLPAQPKDQTVLAAGPASPGAEQSDSTAKIPTTPGDPPGDPPRDPPRDPPVPIIASPETTPAPDPGSHAPGAPALPPQAHSSSANAEVAGPPRAPARSAAAVDRSRGHLATRRGRSAHHHPQPPADAEKHRVLPEAMDRAHVENFSDLLQSLTPPRAGTRNPFDQSITHRSEYAKPVQSLTPP